MLLAATPRPSLCSGRATRLGGTHPARRQSRFSIFDLYSLEHPCAQGAADDCAWPPLAGATSKTAIAAMDDPELVNAFVTESREHLADIEQQLLAIESAGAQADPELVNTVFRSIHSIKGAAGFLGFTTLSRLAHGMENALNLLRQGRLQPARTLTDALLQSADALRAMLDDIEHSNDHDVQQLLASVEAAVAQLLAEEQAQALPATQVQERQADSAETATESTEQAVPSGEQGADIQAASSPQQAPDNQAPQAPGGAPPAAPAQTPPPAAPAQTPPAATVPVSPSLPPGRRPVAPAAETAAAPAAETSIRVSVQVLDRLMNLAGELVLARNQLLQGTAGAEHGAVGAAVSRVNQVTTELQEAIMQTRLQVIGTVFNRFPRVVRDLSAALGKQCQLVLEGQEVELDKSILEAISDPLTHLVRNAVDHGIEPPEERVARGKPAGGTILLRAFHQGGKVHLAISDDGRGIDVARLREKAVALGLISPDQARAWSERDVLQLIFRPGFSTAETVTDVSGRGVGMDVVKTNIERIGGSVTVETRLGQGTTLHVTLPLTLAILPSLIVRCHGRRFAIPQASISELVRIRPGETGAKIQRVKQAEVLRLRDMLLPLVRLETALGIAQAGDESAAVRNVVVLETGHLRYGLAVQRLDDSEEIVVKPLGRHMKQCGHLAGATILGDGSVALILDAAGMAARCQLGAVQAETMKTESLAAQSAGEETQPVLFFRNDPQEQFAVPMHAVARLERIAAAQVDSVGGQRVLQYRGGTLPLVCLEDHIRTRPMPESDHLYVVVCRAAGRQFGLLIREVVDIRPFGARVDTSLFREPGVIGSAVIDGQVTRMLDLFELVAQARPDWLPQGASMAAAPPSDEQTQATVLLAEDSDFFRTRLTEIFEQAGYQVVACPDGAAAWAALSSAQTPIDCLVTDLEMPELDGFELTRKVRAEPALAGLPIVAVTSLASQSDQQRATQAGVDEYHVKLDAEHLLACVGALVQRWRTQRADAQTALRP